MSPRNTVRKWTDENGRRTEWQRSAVSAFAALALSLGGCSAAGDASSDGNTSPEESVSLDLYAPQNLPSDFSVDVPDSLGQGSDPSAGTGRIAIQKAQHVMRAHQLSKAARDGRSGYNKQSGKTALGSSKVQFGKRGILADADGDGYDDDTYEYVGDTSYEYTAMGYYELQNVVSQMQWKKQDVALNFLMADAIFDSVVEYCAASSQDTATESGCSIGDGELSMTFTVEMMNFMLDAMGISTDDPYYSDYAAMYETMIDMELPVPALVYRTLDGSTGYDHQLEFVSSEWEGYSNSTSLRWDSLRTQVELVYGYSSEDWGSGSDSYTYNDTDKRVNYKNTNSYGGTSWTYAMTLQEDSTRAETHGVLFTVRSDYQDSTSKYVMNISGLADDNGGYAETTYTSTYTELLVSSGFQYLTPYQTYYIVSEATCPGTVDWNSVVGSISTWDNYTWDPDTYYYQDPDGVVSSDEAYAYLWGGSGIPSTYSVCTYSWSYDDYTGAFDDGLSALDGPVTLSVGTTYTDMYKYSEGFDANGTLTFSAYASCNADTGECDDYTYEAGTATSASEDEYVDYYDESTSDGALIDSQPVFALSGDTSSIDPSYTYIVFTSDGSGQPDDYWSNVIGYAYYDYWSNCEYDQDGNYTCGDGSWATYYWGTEDEAVIADAYIYTYDPDTWEWSYTATEDFHLTAQ